MPTEEQDAARFRTWTARDWKELRAVWKGLVPEAGASPPEVIVRRFRGEELTAQQAGWVFERWVLEAFRQDRRLVVHDPYGVPLAESQQTKEQVDGLVFDGWQGFVVESKLWPQKVDFGPILLLNNRVEQRPVGTLGLYFSAFDYTKAALELARYLRPMRVVLFLQRDLLWAMRSRSRMVETVQRKWRLAVKYGDPSLPVDEEET